MTNDTGPHAFCMPGWDHYSTWGYDLDANGERELYAQLYRNDDDPDAAPTIWITPPRYTIRTLDELAAAIAEALAPRIPVPPPAEVVTMWLTRPPS